MLWETQENRFTVIKCHVSNLELHEQDMFNNSICLVNTRNGNSKIRQISACLAANSLQFERK